MTDRERLVKLIRDKTCGNNACVPFLDCEKCGNFPLSDKDVDRLADHILADGWMRSPCKVGDVVYGVFEGDVLEDEIILIEITQTATYLSTCTERYMWINGYLYSEMLDQILYFTREEAEKALRGGGVDDK